LKNKVELGQAIRSGVTGSVVVHLSVLALILISTEVHPHRSTAQSIAVDIVAPTEIPKPKVEPKVEAKVEPEPEQKKQLPIPDFSVLSQQAPAASPPQPAEKAKSSQEKSSQEKSSQEKSSQGTAAPQPASPKQAPSRQAAAQATASPASPRPTEPDVTVKYNVMLGLPPEEPPPAEKPAANTAKSEDGFEGKTTTAALKSSVVAEFKRHLKTCSKLPDSVAPSDHIMVKLRVFMTHDGRLAADPVIGGGSANIKAINLLQSAIAALKDCQPYTMLPADRYGEWKVLDLDFTPKDFLG
jgi:hypothetical protein